MLNKLISVLALSIASASFATEVPNTTNTVVLDGVVTNYSLQPLNAFLTKKIETAKKETNKTIDMVINSPGGSVIAGFEFVSLMNAAQDAGYTFNCYVYHVAASMAFQILLQCDNRFALDESFLLWHRARIMMGGMGGSPLTAPQLSVLANSLEDTDSYIFQDLRGKLTGANSTYIRYHFENETLHLGRKLAVDLPHFITSERSIPGLVEALNNQKLTRSAQSMGFFDVIRPGDIIYIWDRAVILPKAVRQ